MDAPKSVSAQLEKLKNLFSKFVDITNDINHDANPPGHKGVMDASHVSSNGDTMVQMESVNHNSMNVPMSTAFDFNVNPTADVRIPDPVTTWEMKNYSDCNLWISGNNQVSDEMNRLQSSRTTFPMESVNHNSMNVASSTNFNLNVNSTADKHVTFVKGNVLDRNLWNSGNSENQMANMVSSNGDTMVQLESVNHNSMNVASSTNFNLNVNSTADKHITLASSVKGKDLARNLWHSGNIENQVTCELQLIAKNQVMGINLPVECDFTESGLEYLKNKTSQSILTNYFYYMFDGNDAEKKSSCSAQDLLFPVESVFKCTPMSSDNHNSMNGTPVLSDNHNSMNSTPGTPVSSGKHNSMNVQDAQVNESQSITNNEVMGIETNELIFIESGLEDLNNVDAACRKPNPEYTNDEEPDDYDEELFKSFVEKGDDLIDVENTKKDLLFYQFEGCNDLRSILETLTERKSHVVDLMPSQGMPHNDSVSVESQNHSVLNIKRLAGSCDNTKMFVKTSDQKSKKLCCPYCTKLYCKLARHVEEKHKDEPAVQKLRAYPKGSKMRRKIQDAIRKVGTYKWNTDSTLNNGELIVSRRPQRRLNKMATDYLTCPNCIGSYAITNIRNHFAYCTKRAFKGKPNIKILSRAVEGRFSSEASGQLQEVIPIMRADAIVELIRYDWLLVVYGNLLCLKYSHSFQQNMIRAKLRLAGRVLQAMKTINSDVTDFSSMYQPKRYKSLIEAIKVVGKYDPLTNDFGTPATALSAITSIKQIGSILKCEFIEREDRYNVERTDDFLYLMESQLTSIINKRVKENQLEKRRDKDHKVPSMEDVRLLSLYMDRERQLCFEELSARFSTKTWIKLSELTIASIVVFNRRRVGESQNATEKAFNKRETIDEKTNESLFGALSEEGKKVAKRFCRMKVRGKRGHSNLNVLLKADVVGCIELLLSHRKTVGVSPKNKYLFALPSSPNDGNRIKVVNACKVLTSYSVKCGAEDPSTLRGTNLRKHFASKCQAMELKDDMVAEVAKFMGHAELVHRQYYRDNPLDREVVKIAMLLEAAQGIKKDDVDSECDNSECDNSESDNSDDEDEVTTSKSTFRADTKKSKQPPSGQKCKKVSDSNERPNKQLCSAAVTATKAATKAAQKRKKINGGKQPPKKKLCKTSVSGSKSVLEAGQKRTINSKKAHTKNKSTVSSTKSVSSRKKRN